MLIPVPGSSPLPISLAVLVVILARVFVPALAIPTLFIFPSSKPSLLLQMVYCYLVILPVPIRPCPHHLPIVCPCPRCLPPMVDCCIYFRIPISISSPFQTVFQFRAAVPQCRRGRRCRQWVWTKDKDEGQGRRARTWTKHTNEERGGPMRSLDDGQRAWMMDDGGR